MNVFLTLLAAAGFVWRLRTVAVVMSASEQDGTKMVNLIFRPLDF